MAFFYLGLLGVGGVAWLKQTVMMGRHRDSRLANGLVLGLLLGLLFVILGNVSRHRETRSSAVSAETGGLTWRPCDAAQIPILLKSGQSVFVDATADWCFTCKYNERTVLDSEEIRQVFKKENIVLMKADWTNYDAAIGEYLKSFNRYGIPFYALYRPGKKPVSLSEFLTKGKVLKALRS
jgi:thiol:disulfide interchange protein